MDEIRYIGEVLWPSSFGHLLAIIAFVAALVGAFSYLKAANTGEQSWNRLGRSFFTIHALSVFSIIGLLLYLMIVKRYEYSYVWEHVSNDLPMEYLLSAFWEGQEGSFLLWMFWHAVLGFALIAFSRAWEARTMWVLMLVQLFIASMLVGLYINPDFKVGVDPFALLRDTMQAPIFSRPDYLTLIEGNGLNPLLQNYWMIIHPPTLFLGFASVTIPFCFAIGSLQQKDFSSWLKPVLPWALFSSAILGTGILMGGAWAYEALSFGGYWAWDPVENMSLVPWLILVAGLHANLIARSTGHSIRLAFAMYAFAFVLVLYSTFLTRSGILGDSSAHAFTQMGLEWQLVAFIFTFLGMSVYHLVRNWKSIPVPEKEERISSREFWMFVGTLVLLFSAILITFTTSIPVYNKLLDIAGDLFNTGYENLKRSMPVDPVAHYNKFQLGIAVAVAFLSGTAVFMRYRSAGWSEYKSSFYKEMAVSGLVALALTILLGQWIHVVAWQYWLLMGSAAFAICASTSYLLQTIRRSPKMAGSATAHLGFGVMIIGIMASGLNKSILSSNEFAQRGLTDNMDPARYITLIKDRPMFMNGYWVEYQGDTIMGNMREFELLYSRVEEQDTVEQFMITPNVLFNNALSKVEATNPSTKHYLSKDIFTYVAALPGEQMDIEEAKRINDTLNYVLHELAIGDTLETDKFQFVINGISTSATNPDYEPLAGDLAVEIEFDAVDKRRGKVHPRDAMMYLREGLVYGFPAQVNDLNMRIRLSDEVLRAYYVPEEMLSYTEVALQLGQTASIGGATLTMEQVDRSASNPNYFPQEGDIAVGAVVRIDNQGASTTLLPVYLIRNSVPMNIKAFDAENGFHLRLDRIDPETETFHFSFAVDDLDRSSIPVEIATNVPRNDIVVIEAIVFPGINLFWAGSLLMIIGLFIALWAKRKKRTA